MGASNEAWLFAFHGLLAAALAVTSVAKIGRSLPKAVAARRWRRVVLGSILSFATVASVVAGFAWVASGRLLTIGAWTVLTLHAWIGIVLIPIAVDPSRATAVEAAGPAPSAGVAAQRRSDHHPTAHARGRRPRRSVRHALRCRRGGRSPDRRCPALHGLALAPGGRRATEHDLPGRRRSRTRSRRVAPSRPRPRHRQPVLTRGADLPRSGRSRCRARLHLGLGA